MTNDFIEKLFHMLTVVYTSVQRYHASSLTTARQIYRNATNALPVNGSGTEERCENEKYQDRSHYLSFGLPNENGKRR